MNLDQQDRLNQLYHAYEALCLLAGEAKPCYAQDVAQVLAVLNMHFLNVIKDAAKGD